MAIGRSPYVRKAVCTLIKSRSYSQAIPMSNLNLLDYYDRPTETQHLFKKTFSIDRYLDNF